LGDYGRVYMICFEIWVNGKKKVVAGQDKLKILSAEVLYCHLPSKIYFNVTGTSWEEGVDALDIIWDMPILKLGDEVKISIVESDSPDSPTYNNVMGLKVPPPKGWGDGLCSFCGEPPKENETFAEGPGVSICYVCADINYRKLAKQQKILSGDSHGY